MDGTFNSDPDSERKIDVGYDPCKPGGALFIDIAGFSLAIAACFDAVSTKKKHQAIKKLLSSQDWIILHTDRHTDCSVYTEKEDMDHAHEIATAKALTQKDYDVLFAPSGMFKRFEKRFDVFLIRGHVILKADLKSISSKNPDTIANRIKGGAEQASRIVIDIVSDIDTRNLVDGLRSGVVGLKEIKEVLLFFRNKFYRLTRQEIMGKNIYKMLG